LGQLRQRFGLRIEDLSGLEESRMERLHFVVIHEKPPVKTKWWDTVYGLRTTGIDPQVEDLDVSSIIILPSFLPEWRYSPLYRNELKLMKHPWRLDLSRLEPLLPLLIFAVLARFTYTFFDQTPYAGIYFSPQGIISRVYVTAPADRALRVGDQLVQVGPVAWADFMQNLRQPLFVGVKPGQIVPITIQRDEQELNVAWVFPGRTTKEVWERLYSDWPLTYIFWLAGTATLLILRPKDERWYLLIAFNFLTALWLAAGSMASLWHIGDGAIILRIAVWLSVPVYLHLHWVFPAPLSRLPSSLGWALYLLAAGMAVLEWFQIPSPRLYLFGFLLALSGSVGLMISHSILRPAHRREIRRLLIIWAIALLPPIFISLLGALSKIPTFSGGLLIALPALPAAYLYIAYHRQLGPHEIRANRFIALYLFLILLITALAILIPVTEALLPGNETLIEFGVPLLSVVVAILNFARFQRFVERRILGVPWSPTELLETYAGRITTRLDTASLAKLLSQEVLPSLFVRQSALLRYDENRLDLVYLQEIDSRALPVEADLPALLAQAGKYRAPVEDDSLSYSWVRLILPLTIGSELSGLWLLGRRDPDDFYAQAEITTLQTLAHQTAIALTNIVYAERLHALYQTSIDQREAERASLGHELHDHILQKMFLLHDSAAALMDSPSFAKAYETVIRDLRDLIRGLRPPMLEYGLYRSLVALADDWTYRSDTQRGLKISLAVIETDFRYPPQVELHLYRIVQQAGENALRHAHARNIRIHGCLEGEHVELSVEDDGLGFEVEKLLDLTRPEARSHFGLIGMRERATLINAQIKFDSAPGQGTRVHLKWHSGD
jgi:signal transduction histidine kinase